MSFRTTVKMVREAFSMHYVPAMQKAGFDVNGWHLHEGSSTYGYQWKIVTNGQHMPYQIHLGLTRTEAFNTLHAMANAVESVNALNGK